MNSTFAAGSDIASKDKPAALLLCVPWLVGVLLGLSAGTVGVRLGIGPIRLSSLLTLAAVCLAIASVGINGLLAYRPSRIESAAYLFVVGGIVLELYNSIQLEHQPRFDTSLQWLFYIVGFLAARLTIKNDGDRITLLRGLVLVAPFLAIIGIAQAVNYPPIVHFVLDITQSSSALGRYERNEFTRATGLIGHWTGFGSYLIVMAVGILALNLLKSRLGQKDTKFFVLRIVLVGLGILCTLTLSSIVAFFLVTIVYLWKSRRLGLFSAGAIIAMGVSSSVIGDLLQRRLTDQFGYNPGALAQNDGLLPETLAYRFEIWSQQTIPAISERPLTGWGQGFFLEFGKWLNFPNYVTWQSAESQWLLSLINGGVVGLILMIFVVFEIYRGFARQERDIKSVLTVFLLSCVATAFTVPQFTNAGLPAALLILCALFHEGRPSVNGDLAPDDNSALRGIRR